MQRNDYEKEVFNGDMGEVVRVEPFSKGEGGGKVCVPTPPHPYTRFGGRRTASQPGGGGVCGGGQIIVRFASSGQREEAQEHGYKKQAIDDLQLAWVRV